MSTIDFMTIIPKEGVVWKQHTTNLKVDANGIVRHESSQDVNDLQDYDYMKTWRLQVHKNLNEICFYSQDKMSYEEIVKNVVEADPDRGYTLNTVYMKSDPFLGDRAEFHNLSKMSR